MKKDFYNNELKQSTADLPWLVDAFVPEPAVATGRVAITTDAFLSFSEFILEQMQAMQRQTNAGLIAINARLDALEIAAAAGPVAIAAPLPFNVGFPPLHSVSNVELTFYDNWKNPKHPKSGLSRFAIEGQYMLVGGSQSLKGRDPRLNVTAPLQPPKDFLKQLMGVGQKARRTCSPQYKAVLEKFAQSYLQNPNILIGMFRKIKPGTVWHEYQCIKVEHDGNYNVVEATLVVANDTVTFSTWIDTLVGGQPMPKPWMTWKSVERPNIVLSTPVVIATPVLPVVP